jgi:enoyl-CoA hydratase
MQELDYVLYGVEDGIATIRINRPEVMNVISRKVYAELDLAFDEAERDGSVKVVIVSGVGKHFGAGHDIGSRAMRDEMPDYPRDLSATGRLRAMDRGVYFQLHDKWRNLSKPTIAAIRGYCIHEYPTQFWELGIKKAKECLWTGDFVDAAEAHRLGMVNHVVPDDKLDVSARWLARRIAINSSYALHLSKMSINQAWDIMGQTAAVRASGNFWLISSNSGREAGASTDVHDRVDWSKNRNSPFDDQDERPW